MSILGHHPAGGTEAITVHGAGGVTAVGQDNARWTIPGFHMHGIVFIKRAQIGIQRIDILPGGRNQ